MLIRVMSMLREDPEYAVRSLSADVSAVRIEKMYILYVGDMIMSLMHVS